MGHLITPNHILTEPNINIGVDNLINKPISNNKINVDELNSIATKSISNFNPKVNQDQKDEIQRQNIVVDSEHN